MKLKINGEEREFSTLIKDIATLLATLEIDNHSAIAVAVNYELVHRGRWQEAILSEGDEVELVAARQGG